MENILACQTRSRCSRVVSHRARFGKVIHRLRGKNAPIYLGYMDTVVHFSDFPFQINDKKKLTVLYQRTKVLYQRTIAFFNEEKMGRLTIRELRERGVLESDIALARKLQENQRRVGVPIQSIGVICGISEPKKLPNVIGFTEKALRKQGAYDQAALLLQQKALEEASPERAEEARKAAKIVRNLSSAVQLEFDFFGGGNVSIAFQYQDAVTERLKETGVSIAKQHQALAVLWHITRHLGWQTYECTKTAADLCEISGITPNNMAPIIKLLEDIGAIKRVKRGRVKVITVTPEGAFRGNVNNHAKVVERYKLEVIEGGKEA